MTLKFFGATSGRYMLWDESTNSLNLTDTTGLYIGDSQDLQFYHNTHSYIENTTGNLYIKNLADDSDIIFQSDDASGGVVTYFYLDGSIGASGYPSTVFPDNALLRFGTGGDLRLFHMSDHSYIQNHTGDLYIQNSADDKDIVFVGDNGSGGTETYFFLDGSLSSGNPYTIFPDNSHLTFGDGTDLQIYHNATHSYIDNYTGILYIRNNTNDSRIRFQCDDGAGGLATYFDLEGGQALHNGSATTMLMTSWYDNSRVTFGDSYDLQIWHGGTDSYINNSTGDLVITQEADDKDIVFKCDDGSGGTETYYYLDGSEGLNRWLKNGLFNDSVKLIFGTGLDLQIYHDGSNSYISDGGTGNLRIRSNSLRIEAPDSQNIAVFNEDAEVDLYYNGSKKFETTNTGVAVTGGITTDGASTLSSTLTVGVDDTGHDVKFFGATSGRYLLWDESADSLHLADNTKLKVGTSGQLELFSDGTNKYIRGWGGDVRIENYAADKDIIFAADNGSGSAVETYFFLDGSLNTDSTPKTVFPDHSKLLFGSGNFDLRIYHDATDSRIENNTGDLYIINYTDDKDLIFQCDDGSGGIETYFYLDGSARYTIFNRPTQHTDGDYAYFGTGYDLKIWHDGTNSNIQNITGALIISNNADNDDIIFQCDDGSGGVETYFRLDGSASSGNPITNFPDNSFLSFGSSHDFSIYHDSTNTYIANSTNDLYIQNNANNADIIFRSDDGSGGVAEYFRVDGDWEGTQFSKSTRHFDGVSAYFGSSGDLQIVHDGTDSRISNYVGDLVLRNYADDKDIIFVSDDGSGNTTEYFRLDGSVAYTVASKAIRFDDSVSAYFGTGADFYINHDGTNTNLLNWTGDLIIKNTANDKDVIFQCDDGSGGLETYFYLDGSLSSGNPFTIFPDNSYLAFGNDADLKFSHTGGYGKIENETGDLYITTYANDSDMFFRNDDGSGGVTNYLKLNGSGGYTYAYKNILFGDDVKAQFGDGGDLEIYHDGSNSTIADVGTGYLKIKGSRVEITNADSSRAGLDFIDTAAVSLFFNGSKKFETTNTGIAVTGGLTTTGASTLSSTLTVGVDDTGHDVKVFWRNIWQISSLGRERKCTNRSL